MAWGISAIFQILVAVYRWHEVLFHQGIQIHFTKLLRFFWMGLFFNQVLPSSVGGDALRGYYLCREGVSLGQASIGVLLDRLFGMLGLVILVLVMIPSFYGLILDEGARLGVLAGATVALAAIGALFMLDRLPPFMMRWRVARGLSKLASDARRQVFSMNPGIRLVALSTGIHFVSIIVVGVLARAMGLEIAWAGLLVLVPLATLFMMMPVSIAGWGVREGIMVFGLAHFGVDAAQALALSILYGMLLLAVALPGGLIWLVNGHSFGRSTPEILMDEQGKPL